MEVSITESENREQYTNIHHKDTFELLDRWLGEISLLLLDRLMGVSSSLRFRKHASPQQRLRLQGH